MAQKVQEAQRQLDQAVQALPPDQQQKIKAAVEALKRAYQEESRD